MIWNHPMVASWAVFVAHLLGSHHPGWYHNTTPQNIAAKQTSHRKSQVLHRRHSFGRLATGPLGYRDGPRHTIR